MTTTMLEREVKIADKTIKLTFNKFAKQANGTVMVTCGDTQVLVTVCAASGPKEGVDFFPLTVDYIEKYYAAGRIPGGYIKRETKPSEREVLVSRVIDRPLRPSFPETYVTDTFVTAFVVSLDPKHHPAPLALLGASTALMISDIPFNGPVASLRIGMKDGQYIIDPPEFEESDLDLNIAASPNALLMVEAGANFLSEKQMLDAIDFAHRSMAPLFEMQKEVQKLIGKPKRALAEDLVDPEIRSAINEKYKADVRKGLTIKEKGLRNSTLSEVEKKALADLNPDGVVARTIMIKKAYDDLKSNLMRDLILKDHVRIDGRKLDEIRTISCETAVLRRAHGSSLFTRGETQSLASVTLGAKEDDQRMDTIMSPDFSKRFFLHYNFPPFSVGEARPMRAPGRREVGHGALAERALERIMPSQKDFGYTVRVVSEILESNGSSSMASVCAGTMALLDAGVPVREPVAGIAMGLVKEGDDYAVLSDILGDEDHLGDMDFKVCGGQEGITALQMDIKISGLSREILQKALEQARVGRQFILGKLNAAIKTPNQISDYAPRIFSMKISVDKIRDLIGPGGKTIKKIIADSGVKIDIDDSGIVNIVSPDSIAAEAAKKMIAYYTTEPEVNGIYLGTVKKIVDFGAFIEIKPGCEGLCHISNLENRRVDKVTDILNENDEVLVKVLEIDRQGKIKLSRKDALGKQATHS